MFKTFKCLSSASSFAKSHHRASLLFTLQQTQQVRTIKTDINRISRGDIIKDGPNKYLQVERFVFAKRARSSAVVTFETVDMLTGKKMSKKYKGDTTLDLCEYTTKDVTFAGENNKGFLFEDVKDGTEYMAPRSIFTPEMIQIIEGGKLSKIIIGIDEETNNALKVMFPTNLICTVEETEAPISGVPNDRHSPITKNAVLDIGLTIKVPGFIATGDRIKVSTRDWSYSNRATEEEEQTDEYEEPKYDDEENSEPIEDAEEEVEEDDDEPKKRR